MKSVRRIAALILCAALVFSTGISAASYGLSLIHISEPTRPY